MKTVKMIPVRTIIIKNDTLYLWIISLPISVHSDEAVIDETAGQRVTRPHVRLYFRDHIIFDDW